MFGKITLTDLSIHSWTMGENIPMMWDKTGNYAIVLDGELYDRTDLYNYIDDFSPLFFRPSSIEQ